MGRLPNKPENDRHLLRICEEITLNRRTVTGLLIAAIGLAPSARAQQRSRRRQIAPQKAPATAIIDALKAPIAPQFHQVRRADDFLVLDYKLHNLRMIGAGKQQRIARIKAQNPAWLSIRHQAQSIAEQAYWDALDASKEPAPTPPGSARSRISGPSRLVFQMPSEISEADWGLDGLLEACRNWPMRLDPLAKPPPPNLQYQIVPQNLIKSQRRRLKISLQRLDQASQYLLASLPADQREAVGAVIPEAAQRIAAHIQSEASGGRALSDIELDAIVGVELKAGLSTSKVTQNFEHAFLSRRALEAAAASASVGVLREISAPPDRTRAQRQTTPLRVNPSIGNLAATLALKPHEPDDTVTAIELPYRLVQTPLATAGWSHEVSPVEHSGRAELWHTRLGRRVDDGVIDFSPEPMRAIWSPDYALGQCAIGLSGPPRWALYGTERRDLVRLTAGYNEKVSVSRAYTPLPTTAHKLMLTGLGGWLDLHGDWKTRPAGTGSGVSSRGVNIESWTHKTALGRDYFVRIVKAGYLFPFGHRASYVRITERKFETRPGGGRIAVLRQRGFIIVREPVREYTGANQPHDGRDFPFRRVEILTKVTPDLKAPGEPACNAVFPNAKVPPKPGNAAECKQPTAELDAAFVPARNTVAADDYLFEMVGVDGAGRRIPFFAPLVMVLEDRNAEADLETVIDFYAGDSLGASCGSKKSRATTPVNGAVIQYALQAKDGDLEGDTNIPTKTLTFKGVLSESIGPALGGKPNFFPAVEEAAVVLPAVKNILGSDKTPNVAYHTQYLAAGFAGANEKAQLFLNIADPDSHKVTVGETEPSDKFGGMITPNLSPSALSRNFGVVAGQVAQNGADNAADFLNGFDPSNFLPDAKLLGAIELKDILNFALDLIADKAKVPQFKTVELPEKIEAVYTIEQTDLKAVEPLFDPMPGNRLKIDTKLTALRDSPDEPTARIEGRLDNFQINLFSCIILTFTKLSFVSEPGKKAKVDVDLDPEHGVMFGGPLEFINELKDIIPTDGFADPSPVQIAPTGITAGYSLGLPTIQVGICSIENISIGAAFSIPFTGAAPSARFNFAERESPFTITVSMFGGGGFVAVVIDTGGMREIEAALEFGAKIAFDIGVASGGVYVKGGFYFSLKIEQDQNQNDVESIYFEGFVELGGHLSVLGLISVSLTFHLALAYEKDGVAKKSRLFGQASLTIEVEILFFSTSVTMKIERQFSGSDADPLFIDLMPDESLWREYCDAYA